MFIMCILYRICLTMGSNVLWAAQVIMSLRFNSIYWRGFTHLDQRGLFNLGYNLK